MPRRTAIVFAAALLLCAIFFAEGFIFIRQAGLQEDEVQFVAAILPPLVGRQFVEIGGRVVPLMIATYAGGLKALVYMGIFSVWPPDAWSLRIPMLLTGTLTVFLFFVFFRMVMGDLAALIATTLLVADPVFLILTVLDSGIVTVQHFLLAAALPLFVRFHRTGRRAVLALACFLCGLALWDKATFVWVLAGLGSGLLAVFPRAIRPHLTAGRILVAFVFVLLGALPLIYYTATTPRDAASGMGGFETPTLQKLRILIKTLDGSSLFGFVTRDPVIAEQRPAETGLERAAAWLSNAAGHPWHDGLPWAALASAGLIPFLGPGPVRRLMLFCVVAFAAGWLVMLPFAMGGGGSHHVILLWPLPQMLVAAGVCALLSPISRARPAILFALVVPLALSCVLATNEYYAQLVLFGTPDYWSDAIYPLHRLLARAPATGIYTLDWGIEGPLRCLGRGRLPLRSSPAAHLLLAPGPAEFPRRGIEAIVQLPHQLFVYYVNPSRHVSPALERVRDAARASGLGEELVAQVADRNGRPVYRVVRFVPAS